MAYATVAELQGLLRLDTPTATQTTAMERCLEAAATEIDWELGYTEADPAPTPPPDLVVEVNLERAVEHWRSGQSPFGVDRHRRRSRTRRHRPQQLVPAPPETRPPEGACGDRMTLAETMEAIADALQPLTSRDRRATGVPVPALKPDAAGAGHLSRRTVPDRGRLRDWRVAGVVHHPRPRLNCRSGISDAAAAQDDGSQRPRLSVKPP